MKLTTTKVIDIADRKALVAQRAFDRAKGTLWRIYKRSHGRRKVVPIGSP